MRAALFACLISLVLGACADQTAILVQISSTDIAVPTDVDALQIRAHTPDHLMFDQTYPIRSSWPQSLSIRPASGEDLGDVRIEVTAMLGGTFVTRRAVLTTFMAGQVRRVDIQLTRDCVGVMCADDVDCVAGVCQGPIAMIDAGPADAGHDASAAVDAGNDASSSDGGTDAAIDAAGPCAAASCLGRVVISEMSPSGTNEFIELYNRSAQSADLSGCTIQYASGTAALAMHATLAAGTTIASHGYYLLGHVGYTGTPMLDQPIGSSGFLDTGGAVAVSCGTTVIDLLGYGTAMHEGAAPTRAFDTTAMPLASYERKASASSTAMSLAMGSDATAGNGQDSDDNGADFVTRAIRDPQATTSAHEP